MTVLKVQIIGLRKENKTTKVIAETTKTGLRTIKWIFKTWKDSGEHFHLQEKKKGLEKHEHMNDRDRSLSEIK